MNKKRKFTNNSLWWLDINILNTNSILFNYLTESNIFTIQLSHTYYYYYFLINKNNLNILHFSNLDATVIGGKVGVNCYYITTQTTVCDFKILIKILFYNKLQSISQVYLGNTWIEREVREFYSVFFTNLLDSRKLLSNYNYNNNLEYNQFNNIIYDINI